jgi:hypothetical protein
MSTEMNDGPARGTPEWSPGVHAIALLVVGGLLMLLAHFLGLLGWGISEGRTFHPPYWWSYLILFPLTGYLTVGATSVDWRLAAFCLCAPPILYFTALGIRDGSWVESDAALLGAVAALTLTAGAAFRAAIARSRRAGRTSS